MNRTDTIFRMFLKANDIAETVDFARKTRLYSGLAYDNVSKEALQGTPEFGGFVDGYSGNHHSGKGAQGTPERAVDVPERLAGIISARGFDLADMVFKADALLSNTAQGRYAVQYEKGRSFRTGV